ncbi:MAG: response regulator transcription factor [Actinomycetia bacterium]|nr:response regulator transcription factor [Actinomycetes bacterium]
MRGKVLVVDDEPAIQELVRFALEREGFEVSVAQDGWAALAEAERLKPDLVVLDLMLPGLNGFEVCRALRATSDVPVLMLTARKEESDRVQGLDLGADDYVTKPFSPRELAARVKAILRRVRGPERETAAETGLVVDAERRRVLLDGQPVELTYTEFELLRVLAAHPGRVFTRDELLTRVWGADFYGDARTVDVHIRHLREKLHEDPMAPRFIETVRGVGYRFREV